MNIFYRITLKSLRENRSRTLVTVIGILLSAAMFSGVTTLVQSIQQYALESYRAESGDWFGRVEQAGEETGERLRNDPEVARTAALQYVGYAEIPSRNESKPYLYLTAADEEFYSSIPVRLVSGHLPEAENEILLPEHLLDAGEMSYKIGDVLELDIGDRVGTGEAAGMYYQFNPMAEATGEQGEGDEGETLRVRGHESYTICGFYERPSFESHFAPGYTALVAWRETEGARYDYYIKTDPADHIYEVENYCLAEGGSAFSLNYSYLALCGSSKYDSYYEMLYGYGAVILVLILLGSVALIYNAFTISVSERTRQFGLLASLGATKKQLRKAVRFEACILALIGIPLGVLAGIGGIAVLLQMGGELFQSIFYSGYEETIHVQVSVISVVTAAALDFVTIWISAAVPARRAARIPAMEAIRQNQDIRLPKRLGKMSPVTYRLFRLPGLLARKYYKCSKKKYRATVISLALSIVLFLSASAFGMYMTQSAEISFGGSGYDFSIQIPATDRSKTDGLLEEIKTAMEVRDSVGGFEGAWPFEVLASEMEEPVRTRLWQAGEEKMQGTVTLYFVEDAVYEGYLREQGMDAQEMGGSDVPAGLLFSTIMEFDVDTQRYEKIKYLPDDTETLTIQREKELEGFTYLGRYTDDEGVLLNRYRDDATGEEIMLPWEDSISRIGLAVRSAEGGFPKLLNSEQNIFNSMITVIYPQRATGAVLALLGEDADRVDSFINLTSGDQKVTEQALKELLAERQISRNCIYNAAENEEAEQKFFLLIQVLCYGFVALIGLIALVNVFNTVTTNMNLRRREFAMLKSVGMGKRDFYRMAAFECAGCCAKALLFGFPISVLMTWWIFKITSSGFAADFRIPWAAAAASAALTFVIVFLTMAAALRRMRKTNVIEVLRNENL